MANHITNEMLCRPINIYELCFDSWMQSSGVSQDSDVFYSELSPYLRQLGVTHLLPSDGLSSGTGLESLAEKLIADGTELADERLFDNAFEKNHSFTEHILSYIAVDPYFRKGVHKKLTDAVNSCRENSILSLAFGKAPISAVDAAFGSYDEKFANVRLVYALMMTVPGKKHTFMGNELAPFKRIGGGAEPEWFMLKFERHKQMQLFTAEMGNVYLTRKDLHCGELRWLISDPELNIIAFRRGGLVSVFNFSPVDRYDFAVDAGVKGLKEVFSSDAARFGGSNRLNTALLKSDGNGTVKILLPGLSAVIFEVK